VRPRDSWTREAGNAAIYRGVFATIEMRAMSSLRPPIKFNRTGFNSVERMEEFWEW